MAIQNKNGDISSAEEIRFKNKVWEWRGYIKKALEEVEKSIKRVEDNQDEIENKFYKCRECRREEVRKSIEKLEEKLDKRIEKYTEEVTGQSKAIHKRVNKIYLKVAFIATSVGVVSSIVFGFLQKYIIGLLGE